MKAKIKELYEAPWTQVLKVANEGVICTSGNTEDFSEGNNYGDGDFNS